MLNEGQLDWLPSNPRTWTATDLDRTKQSLVTDPDFQEDKPILVVALPDGKLLVFAGNLRTTAAKALALETFEAIQYTPESAKDKTTIKRRALLDNGSFGSWDMDALANEWSDLPLLDFGVPAWEEKPEKEHEDKSSGVQSVFQICIDCEDELDQERIYNELKDQYKCRVLTL